MEDISSIIKVYRNTSQYYDTRRAGTTSRDFHCSMSVPLSSFILPPLRDLAEWYATFPYNPTDSHICYTTGSAFFTSTESVARSLVIKSTSYPISEHKVYWVPGMLQIMSSRDGMNFAGNWGTVTFAHLRVLLCLLVLCMFPGPRVTLFPSPLLCFLSRTGHVILIHFQLKMFLP